MRHRLLVALFALILSAPLAAQGGAPVAPVARLDSAATILAGRKYTDWFYADLGDSIVAHSSPQVKEKITSAQLSEIQGQLAAQVGTEVAVISETVVAADTLSGYLREVKFEMMDEPLVLAFTLGRTGLIYGFFIRPKSQMPAEQAK
jgi:uncharacterized Zn-binding protein involved in type VI secretion